MEVPSPLSPVAYETRALAVTLPEGLTPSDFETALQGATSDCSLIRWAGTEEARLHLQRVQVSLHDVIRMTSYRQGGVEEIEVAQEILFFRPRRDGDRLARLAERIVLQFLKLID